MLSWTHRWKIRRKKEDEEERWDKKKLRGKGLVVDPREEGEERKHKKASQSASTPAGWQREGNKRPNQPNNAN